MQWWNAETIHRRSEGWNVKWLLECVVTCWLIWFQQYGQQYRISVQQRIMYSALHRELLSVRGGKVSASWKNFKVQAESSRHRRASLRLWVLTSPNHERVSCFPPIIKNLKKIMAKSNHEGAHEMGVSLFLPQFFHAFCTNCSYNTFINQLLSCLPRAPENNLFWS